MIDHAAILHLLSRQTQCFLNQWKSLHNIIKHIEYKVKQIPYTQKYQGNTTWVAVAHWEMIVRFPDIGEIVDHHRFRFLFIRIEHRFLHGNCNRYHNTLKTYVTCRTKLPPTKYWDLYRVLRKIYHLLSHKWNP